MAILAINTASSTTSIALLERKKAVKLLAEKSWHAQNDEAEKLMPAIDKLLKSQKLDFADIDEVIVIKGPGSFTGLRIGVTTANTIAYLKSCKLYELSTFDYWHATSTLPVLVFAGSAAVYISEKPGAKIKMLDLPEAAEYLEKRKVHSCCGDISLSQEEEFFEIKFIKSKHTFGQIMSKVLAKKLKSVKLVKPLYIKEPGITKGKRKW